MVLPDHEWNSGLASDPPQNKEQFFSPQKDEQPVQNDQMSVSVDQEQNHSDDHSLNLNLEDSHQKSFANMSVMSPEDSEPNLQLFSNGSQEEELKHQRDDGQDGSGSTPQEETKPNSPQPHRDLIITNIHSLSQSEPHFSSSKGKSTLPYFTQSNLSNLQRSFTFRSPPLHLPLPSKVDLRFICPSLKLAKTKSLEPFLLVTVACDSKTIE